jgi:hypothetical protein
MELTYFAVRSLTGYGFIHSLRQDLYGPLANTEDVGNLDAPERIAGGGMESVTIENGRSQSIQILAERDSWPF